MIEYVKIYKSGSDFQLLSADDPAGRMYGFVALSHITTQKHWCISIDDVDKNFRESFLTTTSGKRLDFMNMIKNPHKFSESIQQLLLICAIHES